MRIECPRCAAVYDVPESRVGTGRVLRCGSCGAQWRVEPPGASVAEPPPERTPAAGEEPPPAAATTGAGQTAGHSDEAKPTRAPIPARPERTIPTRAVAERAGPERLAPETSPPVRNVPLTAAWIASIIVIAAAVAACFIWREDVERIWPASARVLGAVVLPARA